MCLVCRLALRSDGEFGRAGTCFAEILEHVRLPEPEFAVHRGGSERATTEGFVLTDACVQRMMEQTFDDGSTVRDHAEHVLRRLRGLGISVKQAAFDAAGNLCFLPRTAFQIPLGLCYLASHLSWRSLALVPNSKWDADCDAICLHQEVRYFADRCQFQGSAIADFVAPSVLQPSNQLFTALAEDLCQWASSIVSASEDPELTTNDLEQYVIWLNSLREASSSKRRTADHQWEKQTSSSFSGRAGGRGAFNPSTGTRGRYRTMFSDTVPPFCFASERVVLSSTGFAESIRDTARLLVQDLGDLLQHGKHPFRGDSLASKAVSGHGLHGFHEKGVFAIDCK